MERLVELIICLAPGWPLARHLSRLNRRNRWLPKTIAGTAGLALYVALVVVCALYAPMILRVIAVLALVLVGLFFWRSSPSYGRRQGLPPGSLAPASGQMNVDQAFYLKQSAQHGGVFKTSPGILAPHVCVVGHPLALDFLKANGRDLVAPTPAYNERIPKGFLRYMGEQDHRDYHKLFQGAMPPALIGANEAALAPIIEAGLIDWSKQIDGVVVEQAVIDLMFSVMAKLFFGIGLDDKRHTKLKRLHDKISYGARGRYDHRDAEPALVEIERLLFAPTEGEAGGDTVLGRITALAPEACDDPTVRRNLIYMMETGHRDVAGLLTWVLKLLSDNRVWIDRLANPERDAGLADRVVLETLRLERSEYLYRKAAKDVRVGPFKVPKGWIIRICIREGHRTNKTFDQPNEFNPDRFIDREFSRTDYAPFGLYQRRCIGQNITIDVCRLFLETLFGHHELDVIADGPVSHRGGHWHPNDSFRVRLA